MVPTGVANGDSASLTLSDQHLPPRGKLMETLYERVGGEPTIEKLVTAFYQRVLSDPLLSPFFAKTEIPRLKRMQKAFFSLALGGPEPSEQISMVDAHRGRGIERKHLTRFTEHLVETLAEMGIDEEDSKEIYARIARYSDEVIGDTSVDG